jgi:hypothetical protein
MNNVQLIRKSTLLAMLALAAVSCKTPEETVVDNGSVPTEENRVIGTVHSTGECGFYIEIIVGDVTHSLSPVNLDMKYQEDGMRIKFAYEKYASKPPAACPNFEPVQVADVTPLR